MSSSSRSSSLTPCRSPSPEPPIVQPDHFYGSEGIQLPPSPNSLGKTWLDPEDDLNASRGIPVFKPTMEEFADFEAYMEGVNCWGLKSGIVKVIPPQEWTASLPDIKPQLREVKIRSPIEQIMLGSGGLFRQQNMEKRKIMSVREWAELCNKDEYRAPAKQDVGLESRGMRVSTRQPLPRRGKKKEPTLDAATKAEPVDDSTLMETLQPSSVPSPPASEIPGSPSGFRKGEDSPECKPTVEVDAKGKRVHQTREARQASLADRAVKDNQFIDGFDPANDWLPPNTDAADYTPEYCQKLERHYWRNCSLGRSAWYGADTQGTLFTDDHKIWNVGRLHSALSRLLPSSDNGLPGVNTPYLYFGMWRATFAWHVEDMDLYSINYIHFGAPKFWYAVPQAKANTLEHAMRTYFPKDTSQCPQFLRHKSFLASPTTLAKSSCRPNHLVQQPGEFVITYPRGYHAGFNLGFNCAESVNFALECWLDMGRVAKACKCVSDSVRIDVDQLLRDRAEEAMQAMKTMEAQTPQTSKAKRKGKGAQYPKSPMKQKTTFDAIPRLKIPLKRKADEKEHPKPKSKKIKIKASPSTPSTSALNNQAAVVLPPPKISVKLKLGPKPAEQEPFPCCLCVSTDKTGLLRVHEPPVGRKDASEAAGNPQVWMAHETCASIIPETWVDEDEMPGGLKEPVVFGVGAIVKDRWNLKCSACTKTRLKAHGAPVQCTKGKCPKAFHVSCAKEGQAQSISFSVIREVQKEVVVLESRPHPGSLYTAMDIDSTGQLVPPEPPEARIVKAVRKLECQILCPQHNPAYAAQKKALKQEKIKADLLCLPSMARIKIRVSYGVFEVSLIRVIEETGCVEVLWDRGTKREFKWGSVVFGSTDGLVQQKPSDISSASGPERSVSLAASTVSVPVQTLPTATAATSGGAVTRVSTPNTVQDGSHQNIPITQPPVTTSHYSYTANPYANWTYAPQQVPYGHGHINYTYPYASHYQMHYPTTAQTFAPQAYYSGTPALDGRLQWQRPYQGPSSSTSSTSTTTSGTSASQPSTGSSSHAQGRMAAVAAPPHLAQPHSQSSDFSYQHVHAANPTKPETASVCHTTPPTATANFESSETATTGSGAAQQQGFPDLSAFAQLPPNELTELLRDNPQLREYIMSFVQQTHPPEAPDIEAQA